MIHGVQFWRIRCIRLPLNSSKLSPYFRRIHDARFSPLVPPNPASLPKPPTKETRARKRTRFRTIAYTIFAAGGVYLADRQWNASSITRSMRTFCIGILIGVDYKINFRPHPPLAESIEALHARNAQRVFDLIRANGGLYLKIGQAIAMQSAILPPQFQKMFSRMFDDAPQNDWKDVERVIREDFGRSPEEVFGVSFNEKPGMGVMEQKARASASVAQVHWARLADGREVAIKIQKREIAQQIGWDLWAFKVVSSVYSWWFDLPIYTLVPYISERLMLETDFVNEANNSEEMNVHVQAEPRLRSRVYIPKIYRQLSSRRVMTAEWIEGIRLWDKEGITASWLGEWNRGSPGAGGKPLPSAPLLDPTTHDGCLKPERDQWRGPKGNGGLGLSLKDVMGIMVDLFSAQMFLWGIVHCDPHPGNIFIRRLPSGKPELVLIDHGLYIHMTPEFRQTYARFWKALISFDNETIQNIVKSWGVNSPDLFASATLMRPYSGGNRATENAIRADISTKDENERMFEMQRRMKGGVKQILGDETKLPKELIFIGRNLRIVQGNNQYLGSPVNRIKITGIWASRALAESRDISFRQRLTNWGSHLVFRFGLLLSDLVWMISRLRQMVGRGKGMEDDIEEQMKTMLKDYGVELNHKVFDG